jgi:deoxyribonuclease-4
MLLGAHESISGAYTTAVGDALEDGCECIQIFTKNQTQWKEPAVDEEKVLAFKAAREKAGIGPVLAHDSYLVNLASDNLETRRKSVEALLREMERCERLGLEFLVMHPGAHMGRGEGEGLELVAAGLGEVLAAFGKARARILLETTAGQGSSLGCRFEHFAWLLKNTRGGKNLGVCFDTAHVFAAGYDIKSADGYEKTFADFDRIVGLERLLAFHLNDSKKDLATRVDRHEHIGQGKIGRETFRRLLRDSRFGSHPGILETPGLPGGERGFRENLLVLKKLRGRKTARR